MFKSAIAASLAALATANSVPIYGYYPGYVEGGNALNISIEMFYDSICTDSAAQNLVINELLGHLWHGAPVYDQVKLMISYMPLPYHYHTYQTTELMPYFMDLCIADTTSCYFNEYKDFCFENATSVLSMTDLGKNEFITYWTGAVATEFGLNQADL